MALDPKIDARLMVQMKLQEAQAAKKRFDSEGELQALQGALLILEERLKHRRGTDYKTVSRNRDEIKHRFQVKRAKTGSTKL